MGGGAGVVPDVPGRTLCECCGQPISKAVPHGIERLVQTRLEPFPGASWGSGDKAEAAIVVVEGYPVAGRGSLAIRRHATHVEATVPHMPHLTELDGEKASGCFQAPLGRRTSSPEAFRVGLQAG